MDLTALTRQMIEKWGSWGLKRVNDPPKGTQLGKILSRTWGQFVWLRVLFASSSICQSDPRVTYGQREADPYLLEPSFLPRFTFIKSISLNLSLTVYEPEKWYDLKYKDQKKNARTPYLERICHFNSLPLELTKKVQPSQGMEERMPLETGAALLWGEGPPEDRTLHQEQMLCYVDEAGAPSFPEQLNHQWWVNVVEF